MHLSLTHTSHTHLKLIYFAIFCRIRKIHYTFNVIMFLVASRLVYLRSQIARELWNSMLGFCIRMMSKLGVLPWLA